MKLSGKLDLMDKTCLALLFLPIMRVEKGGSFASERVSTPDLEDIAIVGYSSPCDVSKNVTTEGDPAIT